MLELRQGCAVSFLEMFCPEFQYSVFAIISTAPQVPLCRKMLGLNQGLLQRLHRQSDALTARGLGVLYIFFLARCHTYIARSLQAFSLPHERPNRKIFIFVDTCPL
jgi:hypothetical protein